MKNSEIKPKILFLLHLPPPIHGSSMVGKWIYTSKNIQTSFDCQYMNLLASKNVDDSGKITVSKLKGLVITIVHLTRVLIKKKPTISYFALTTTGLAFYRDVFLVLLLRLRGTKLVYHLHNKGIVKASENKATRMIYQWVFKDSIVIVLSERLKSDLAGIVNDTQIRICPNGIPENNIHSINRITNEIPQILFLSNLIESKGIYVLLEALKSLKKRKILFSTLLIGGEGDISENKLRSRLNEMNLENEVLFLGKKYNKEKEKILTAADIFVFPSYYSKECFPLVLLEAMQHSLPVLSTYEGGIPDMIENNVTGFLVNQKDSLALAEKLEILITNPVLRKQMGQAGREKYEKYYTLELFENTLIDILLEATFQK